LDGPGRRTGHRRGARSRRRLVGRRRVDRHARDSAPRPPEGLHERLGRRVRIDRTRLHLRRHFVDRVAEIVGRGLDQGFAQRLTHFLAEPLPPTLRKRINTRKKDYVHFVESLIAEVQRARHAKGSVSPRAAAFALLGMINWIYQWYKPEGNLQAHNLVPQFTELMFGGILA